MSKHLVNIPALRPHANAEQMGLDIGSYVSSQPIIQLKELEVDRVRYDAWKAWIAKTKIKAKRKRKDEAF